LGLCFKLERGTWLLARWCLVLMVSMRCDFKPPKLNLNGTLSGIQNCTHIAVMLRPPGAVPVLEGFGPHFVVQESPDTFSHLFVNRNRISSHDEFYCSSWVVNPLNINHAAGRRCESWQGDPVSFLRRRLWGHEYLGFNCIPKSVGWCGIDGMSIFIPDGHIYPVSWGKQKFELMSLICPASCKSSTMDTRFLKLCCSGAVAWLMLQCVGSWFLIWLVPTGTARAQSILNTPFMECIIPFVAKYNR
jgi:hypothetical protein